jgi:hypothetical protein
LTPVAQNLHKMSIVDPLDCQRFETAADAADLPLRV